MCSSFPIKVTITNDFSAYHWIVLNSLKDLIVYKLDGEILHKEASQGVCLDGEADVGTVIPF